MTPEPKRPYEPCDRCPDRPALFVVTCSYGCQHNQCMECADYTTGEARESAKIRAEDERWAASLHAARSLS